MMLRAADTIQLTDTGRQRRDNEDSMYARAPVFVIADGMGGAQAGEVASRLAVEAFEQGLPDAGSPEERLADRVREANRRIHEFSQVEHERAGMGTTLTAAYLDDAHLAIAHVGDSRAYMFRDGELTRLTEDHSLVEELRRKGKLTEEQAAEHPQRSIITRALGPEATVDVDTWTYPVRAGDVLLLCSDGLTSMVSEREIERILASTPQLGRAGELLIRAANEAGGRDNITVILTRLEDAGAVEALDAPTFIAPPADTSDGSGPPPQARTHGRRSRATAARERRERRFLKPLAALLAIVIVLFLVGGGGYLATRQLYFIGTNSQGIVTIYRGLPYDLPGGIHLYETYFTSGVPAALVPPDRRSSLFDNRLRSQRDAASVVRALELGELSK